MDIKIIPQKLSGNIPFIAGKSHLHRLIIASSLAGDKDVASIASTLSKNRIISDDIKKTCEAVKYINNAPKSTPIIYCGSSGTTLRILLPVFAALYDSCTFIMDDQLAKRPVKPLLEVLEKNGCIVKTGENTIAVQNKLKGGNFFLPGNISSQFISGLLYALPLTENGGNITVKGNFGSYQYVDMTKRVLEQFKIAIDLTKDDNGICTFKTFGGQNYKKPAHLEAERDWSNTAFWLTARFAGNDLKITDGYDNTVDSLDKYKIYKNQPDGIIIDLLQILDKNNTNINIDCNNFPDLVPAIAVAAAKRPKDYVTKLTGLTRLKYKESNRILSTAEMINNLGGTALLGESSITVISQGSLDGGTVDSFGDHRIAMAAAIAASACTNPTIIKNAEAVTKSYPEFFNDFKKLGGMISEEL